MEVARAVRYSGLGVRSVGPVGDFLIEGYMFLLVCLSSGRHPHRPPWQSLPFLLQGDENGNASDRSAT